MTMAFRPWIKKTTMLNETNIRQLIPGLPKNGDVFLPHLQKYLPIYGINTPLRLAHFLAQVGHESGGFRYIREIWGPTPAQLGYEGRKDLGNVQLGDGSKFRGRGLVQYTGRANYAELSQHIFKDARLLDTPQLLEVPEYAVQSACHFWKSRGLNELADKGATKEVIVKVTRKINGGTNGLDDRIKRFLHAGHILLP
jgi:putative chitinase